MAEVVRAEITNASYLPASRESKPVASKMEVRARVMPTPVDGDDYAVKLDAISLAPLLRRATPPRYPIGMAQRNLSGHVTLELTIGADGRVIRTEAVDAADPVFSKEVLAVAKGWRFEPSSVDGGNFEYVVTLPVWFQASKHQTPPEFVCRRDERRPRWKQQSKPDCLDLGRSRAWRTLRYPRVRQGARVRLPRGLLQSTAAPLRARLSQPRRVRAIPCRLNAVSGIPG